MKVKEFIKFLLDFDMDAEILENVGSTYDDKREISISWGGPNFGDGAGKKDAEYIYIGENNSKK